nr:reverse transcriptase domain-containing protein [Tanacetum cinerariifolium]
MVEKQIQEDRGRQLAIMNLVDQYGDEIEAKNELLKAYEQCKDISMDKRAKIENFLKMESKLDYKMQSALFTKVAKLEKQIRDKLVQSNYVLVVPDAYAFRLQPQVLLSFQRMTATLKYSDVPNDAIKLMLFSYSLEGAAKVWYEKELPNSILTWDDLVNKFVNQFFPPSKTTHLKNEFSRFTQRFEETFGEACDHFKEMLRACPHHGFSELTQIDTFYNGLTEQDQDSLNAAAGGNLLNKTTREALKFIENKSKVRYLRSKSNVSRVNTNSRDNVSKTDDRIDKLVDQIYNLVDIVNKQVIAPAKRLRKLVLLVEGLMRTTNVLLPIVIHLVFVRQLVLITKFPRQTELATKFHHLGLLQFKTIQICLIRIKVRGIILIKQIISIR